MTHQNPLVEIHQIEDLSQEQIETLPIYIITVDRGYVFVAYVREMVQSFHCYCPQQIRKWETGCGLGTSARYGDKDLTLDPYDNLAVPRHAMIFMQVCNKEVWTPILERRHIKHGAANLKDD